MARGVLVLPASILVMVLAPARVAAERTRAALRVETADSTPYAEARRAVDERRRALATRWAAGEDRRRLQAEVERAVIETARTLAGHWMGTPWGLGAPQSVEPQVGKINCGTFVGTVLRDSGFNVDVRKLQRQPSGLIIKTFVASDRVRRFSDAPMEAFLASVRGMGPGLFIIGLDFHVGFLIQPEEGPLRFVHASYVTGIVQDEPAATAVPIQTSRYRVVGKLLSRQNLVDWLAGRRIQVKGDW